MANSEVKENPEYIELTNEIDMLIKMPIELAYYNIAGAKIGYITPLEAFDEEERNFILAAVNDLKVEEIDKLSNMRNKLIASIRNENKK